MPSTETMSAGTAEGLPATQAGAPAPARAELLELLHRERANFLGYKRRVERERAADREQAHGDIDVDESDPPNAW